MRFSRMEAWGAFALLTDQEQARAVEIVIDQVNGRVPVMASLGADYISILPPHYFSLTTETVTKFYLDVAAAVPNPIVIYDNPYTTHYRIPLDSIFHLAEIPHIVGLKESDQDVERWQSLTRHFKGHQDFFILIGTEGLVKVALLLGADGVVSGLHDVAPHLALGLYRSVQSGDMESADLAQQKLIELFSIFTSEAGIWGGFEVALNFVDICEKVAASP
jgi:4-hydroxy-tetrahydrodipicolinate synthase